MDNSISSRDQLLQDWKAKNYSLDEIRLELTRAGNTEEDIATIIKEYQKLQEEKRRTIGFVYMAAGAFLGFISCVLTMMDLIPAFTGVFLYGFTTLAIIIVLIGCFLVFE
jgi:hypothetical protein